MDPKVIRPSRWSSIGSARSNVGATSFADIDNPLRATDEDMAPPVAEVPAPTDERGEDTTETRLLEGALDLSSSQVSGEIGLWRACILQAVRDATWIDPRPGSPAANDHSRRDSLEERPIAQQWILGDERDEDAISFDEACEIADLSPEPIRRWVRQKMETSRGIPGA